MSNEDLPQSAELASAYLDGELPEPDRATAAGDPTVMSAVDSFARVRAALNEVGAVDPDTKNAAIAAALAQFDALHSASSPAGATPPAVAAPVISLQSRRHRAFRVVTGAAAAAIVGVVAVAALNSSGGSDDLASLSTAAPAIASAESAPDLKSVAADAGAATEAAPAATDAAAAVVDSATPTVPAIDTTDALRAYAASMQVATAIAAPADTTAAAAAPSVQDASTTGGYAAVACISSDQIVIGAIVYRGTPAIAVLDVATGLVQALADTNCRVLDEVPAP
jgi:hypothetical protein